MNQVLNLQIQLLLHQHGRKDVMEALAIVEDVDLASIQNEIQSLRNKRRSKTRASGGNTNGRKTRRRESAKDLIKEVQLEPDAKSLVEQIALAYERKEFLPELRHVRQYLEEAGKDVSELRFRAEALPEVIAVLSTYSHDRLGKLVESFKYTGGRNDLEILTNEILKPVERATS